MIKNIREIDKNIEILILSSHFEPDIIIDFFNIGIENFIQKLNGRCRFELFQIQGKEHKCKDRNHCGYNNFHDYGLHNIRQPRNIIPGRRSL